MMSRVHQLTLVWTKKTKILWFKPTTRGMLFTQCAHSAKFYMLATTGTLVLAQPFSTSLTLLNLAGPAKTPYIVWFLARVQVLRYTNILLSLDDRDFLP